MSVIDFSDINWGEDEARGDKSLENYFVTFPEYEKILTGEKRFIIGRKGTGKTAILEKIRLDVKKDPLKFSEDVSLKDFPLNYFRGMEDQSLSNKSKYVPAWEFILVTKIISLLLQDCSIDKTDEYRALKRFMDDNFPDGTSVAEIITSMRKNENKIGFSWEIISSFWKNVSEKQITSKMHFSVAVQGLKKIVSDISTDSTFYILIDELDEGYQANNSNLNSVILALLRAVENLYRLFVTTNLKCIFVLALRSDIFNNLEDNDLNKLDDYILRLNWTNADNHPWSLKNIVEQRIKSSVKDNDLQGIKSSYWPLVIGEADEGKELWKYMCALTFSRPRDIIKLMKYCSNRGHIKSLIQSDVKAVENEFSDWFYREFRDEVHSFFSCWQSALNCLSEIAKGKEEKKVLLKKFDETSAIQNWCKEHAKTSLDVMKILFNYSVIGCINEHGRWIFKYKDDHFMFMDSYPSYCVHYGFYRKLRIIRSYDQQAIDALTNYS